MGKSGYLQRRKDNIGKGYIAGISLGAQFTQDCFQIALHRKGWGYQRIKDLTALVMEIEDYFMPALTGGMECEVFQCRLDREIEDILKGNQEVIPFEKRYPTIKEGYQGKGNA